MSYISYDTTPTSNARCEFCHKPGSFELGLRRYDLTVPWKSKDYLKDRFFTKDYFFSREFESSKIGDYYFNSL